MFDQLEKDRRETRLRNEEKANQEKREIKDGVTYIRANNKKLNYLEDQYKLDNWTVDKGTFNVNFKKDMVLFERLANVYFDYLQEKGEVNDKVWEKINENV